MQRNGLTVIFGAQYMCATYKNLFGPLWNVAFEMMTSQSQYCVASDEQKVVLGA